MSDLNSTPDVIYNAKELLETPLTRFPAVPDARGDGVYLSVPSKRAGTTQIWASINLSDVLLTKAPYSLSREADWGIFDKRLRKMFKDSGTIWTSSLVVQFPRTEADTSVALDGELIFPIYLMIKKYRDLFSPESPDMAKIGEWVSCRAIVEVLQETYVRPVDAAATEPPARHDGLRNPRKTSPGALKVPSIVVDDQDTQPAEVVNPSKKGSLRVDKLIALNLYGDLKDELTSQDNSGRRVTRAQRQAVLDLQSSRGQGGNVKSYYQYLKRHEIWLDDNEDTLRKVKGLVLIEVKNYGHLIQEDFSVIAREGIGLGNSHIPEEIKQANKTIEASRNILQQALRYAEAYQTPYVCITDYEKSLILELPDFDAETGSKPKVAAAARIKWTFVRKDEQPRKSLLYLAWKSFKDVNSLIVQNEDTIKGLLEAKKNRLGSQAQ